MSTHKYIDRICCAAIVLAMLVAMIFLNAESLGIQETSRVKGYEARLFDTSRVHTIDIVMDDWDSFLENCTSEEYTLCSVVIDNESYKDAAIRGKGNTSLTQVANYGNNRYSFKIEFDHYDSTKSYYGLDKLSLNNIIQDNTYMKDYLTYQMMGDFGVDAPLCSYAYITVNGEDWGLYLAVEGIEESFLERNYGSDYGELYKPDSQSMGGGRGNGGGFDMDDWQVGETDDASQPGEESQQLEEGVLQPGEEVPQPDGEMQPGGGMPQSDGELQQPEGNMQQQDRGTQQFGGRRQPPGGGTMPSEEGMPSLGDGIVNRNMRGMGSSDVSLIYSDDEYSSYQNIFDNAKTDITDADRDRLIASLKQLNTGENIEEVVNIEEVIRYFVVHNFVCNFDSYTGSMIHNYYLYEENGRFSMIPWDYNLAFGGFQDVQDASTLVNYPIDTPVSGGTVDSRPMLAWIFSDEEYTELYHQYFTEFMNEYFESGYFAEMMDEVQALISPYVEKDPTKFCTYEEYEAGISTLREFCLLRAESVKGQLEGTIASTSDGQAQEEETLIDASDITIADMGSMNHGMGGRMGQPDTAEMPDAAGEMSDAAGEMPDLNGETPKESEAQEEDAAGNEGAIQERDAAGNGDAQQESGAALNQKTLQENSGNTANTLDKDTWILTGISAAVLMAGILTAFFYKKRA